MIKKGIQAVLSVAVLSGISLYVVDAQENNAGNQNEPVVTEKSFKSKSGSVNEVVTKELIHGRMMNTIDNFDSVKGTFTYVTNRTHSKGNSTVDYQVKTGEHPKSYQKTVQRDGSVHESIYSEQKAVKIDHKAKDFSEIAVVPSSVRKWDKDPKTRYKIDDSGNKISVLRDDPTQMLEAKMSILPEELAIGYLENYDTWEIVEQTKLLNLNTVVIEGTFDDYYKVKKEATTYKLWVHQQTGILLKWEERNEKGEVKLSLQTKKIKVNETLDESKFVTDVPTLYKNKFKEEKKKR